MTLARSHIPRQAPAARLRRSIYTALDRQESPLLLELLGSAYMTLRWRERCRIRRVSEGWAHGYRDGELVRPSIGGFPPAVVAAVLHDHFFHTYVPQPGDTLFDIGAGVGEETLAFARLTGPRGRVIAVEAHPATFACLKATCERNNLACVTPLPLAVSDERGSIAMSDSAHHLSNTIMGQGETGVRVETDTVDRVAEAQGVRQIDFLKMNIEGAEERAIAGMEHTIRQVRHAVIACHEVAAPPPESPRSTIPVARSFLESNGFDVFTRDSDPRPWTRNTLYGVNRRLR